MIVEERVGKGQERQGQEKQQEGKQQPGEEAVERRRRLEQQQQQQQIVQHKRHDDEEEEEEEEEEVVVESDQHHQPTPSSLETQYRGWCERQGNSVCALLSWSCFNISLMLVSGMKSLYTHSLLEDLPVRCMYACAQQCTRAAHA